MGCFLLGAFVSFVLSVSLWFTGVTRRRASSSASGCRRSSPSAVSAGQVRDEHGLLFAVGALVTLVVAVGLALPIYGAILDGRYQAQQGPGRCGVVRDAAGRRPAASKGDLR